MWGYTDSCMKLTAKHHSFSVELIPDDDNRGFTARLPDIPAYGEGKTEEEAIADLKVSLQGYIATFGLEDTLRRLSPSVFIRNISIDLSDITRA